MDQENAFFFNVDAMDQGIPRVLAQGLETRVFPGNHAMVSVVRIAPGAVGRRHDHPEEQWGCVLRGSGIRRQGELEVLVKAGDFWRTPGGVEHSFEGGPDGAVVFDVFAPPREAYKGPGAGFGG